jgi:hypothetical protein
LCGGGVAALRGKTNKILVYAALALAAAQIIQATTTIVFHYGTPVAPILGLLLALIVVRNLTTAQSREFFATRGGTTVEGRTVLATGAALGVITVVAAIAVALTADHPGGRTASPRSKPKAPGETILVVDGHDEPVPSGSVSCHTDGKGMNLEQGDQHSIDSIDVMIVNGAHYVYFYAHS